MLSLATGMISGGQCYGLASSLGHTWMPLPWRSSTPDSITGGMANTATTTNKLRGTIMTCVALSNDINEGSEDTRFDGMLIRFTFTSRQDSSAPPSFCLSRDGRLETMVTLFSPHMEDTLEFTIVFP